MIENLLVCVGDGDDIGNVIDFYLLKNDLKSAGKFSCKVKAAIEKIAEDAQRQMKANIIYVAGDDVCFTVSSRSDILEKITIYSNDFFKSTGKTISFGIGRDPVEAAISLRKAKVSGKGRIVFVGEDR